MSQRPGVSRESAVAVPTRQFAAELDYLDRHGYHTVTLEQIYAAMAGRGYLPTKPVAITFDDGALDNYTVAFPLLERHRFVATFFVITGVVGRPERMTWQQLRQMRGAGMAIESHTVHHVDLRGLTSGRLALELTQSRTVISDDVGTCPDVLAYPGGSYNKAVIQATKAAGYRLAVTAHVGTTLHPTDCFAWPRVRVLPGESLHSFAALLEGRLSEHRSHSTGTS